jgi:hypothetical protein
VKKDGGHWTSAAPNFQNFIHTSSARLYLTLLPSERVFSLAFLAPLFSLPFLASLSRFHTSARLADLFSSQLSNQLFTVCPIHLFSGCHPTIYSHLGRDIYEPFPEFPTRFSFAFPFSYCSFVSAQNCYVNNIQEKQL